MTGRCFLFGAWFAGWVGVAVALPPGLTAPEARCQLGLGPATDHLGAREAVCLARCDRKARAGRVPASDCVSPYGGATAACVAAGERRALHSMAVACHADCPECYGGDCSVFATGAVAATGAVVSGLADAIFCGGVTGVDANVARCRAAAAVALAQVATRTGACVVACQRHALQDTAVATACTSDPISDPRAATCIARVTDRARQKLDRQCVNVSGCLADVLPTLVDRVRAQIESDYRNFILCGSAAAAFL